MKTKTKTPVVNYLSIRQPMAWAIIAGHKDIENRDWPTNIRGRILIHAGKSTQWFDGYCAAIQKRGVKRIPSKEDLDFGMIIGSVEIVDCVEKHKSKWYNDAIRMPTRCHARCLLVPRGICHARGRHR